MGKGGVNINRDICKALCIQMLAEMANHLFRRHLNNQAHINRCRRLAGDDIGDRAGLRAEETAAQPGNVKGRPVKIVD